jgi:acetyl esterase
VGLHPQVAALLEQASRSAFPTLDKLTPFVARRLYRERCAAVAPRRPEVERASPLLADTPAGPVAMRHYRPAGSRQDEMLPALVFFHGGGWTIGDLDTHDVLCRELANGARCAVLAVEYRVGPEAPFPAAVEDCAAATRFVFAKAASLGVDAARIAVGGDSAGGTLAIVVSMLAREARGAMPCFQLLIYPATDQRAASASHERNGRGYLLTSDLFRYFRSSYLPDQQQWTDWRASPALAASLAGLPPAFVLTAGYDPLVDEGREFAQRLQRDGVNAAYSEYPDMIHGFIVMGGILDRANDAVQECCAALRGAFERTTA